MKYEECRIFYSDAEKWLVNIYKKHMEGLKKNGNKKTDKRRVTGFRKTERL